MAFSLSNTLTNIVNTGRAFLLGDDETECDFDFMDDYFNEREIRGEFQSPRSIRSGFESSHELRGEFQSPRFIKLIHPNFVPIISDINKKEQPTIICPTVIKPSINRPPTITTKLYTSHETILTEEYNDNSYN